MGWEGWGRGREPEVYGRWENRAREVGFPRWQEPGEIGKHLATEKAQRRGIHYGREGARAQEYKVR